MNSNYFDIIQRLQQKEVTLIAVSKTKSPAAIMALYNAGQRDFGENRVQELREKQEILPKDIRWHLIGHLQSNKAKYVAEWVHLIHAVDSWELLQEINKQAKKNNRVIPCLLQIFIAKEETKFGLSESELYAILENPELAELKNIRIDGLMGMATNTDNEKIVREEFSSLHALLLQVKKNYFSNAIHFKELSMGMSSDFSIAIDEGATMVRIGSLLFGERN